MTAPDTVKADAGSFPLTIFLQRGDECVHEGCFEIHDEGTTWSEHRVNDADVQYTRSDIVADQRADVDRIVAEKDATLALVRTELRTIYNQLGEIYAERDALRTQLAYALDTLKKAEPFVRALWAGGRGNVAQTLDDIDDCLKRLGVTGDK